MGTHRVLVIDEEKSSVSVFGKALEPKGIDVFVLDTPDKGIEKAIEIEPDLIFVNLIFQESNGLKVSKLIHAVEKLRKVPIIMLLSHKSDLDPKYTTTIGVVDVLIRPFTPEDILSKTFGALGIPAAEAAAVEEAPGVMAVEDELQAMAVDESAAALPDWTGEQPAEAMVDSVPASAFESAPESVTDSLTESMPDSVFEQEFVDEADKLIDRSIISPGEGRRNIFDLDDDQPKDDVIHLRRHEEPEAADGDISGPDEKFNEEIAMEERNLFDEDADRKKDAIHRSFEDELEDTEKDEMLRHEPSDDADVYEEELPEEEKPGTGKKVLLAVGGVVLIAGLGLGAYVVKKTYFRDQTVKVAPLQKQEVVRETLPPPAAVNAPEKPAAPAAPAVSPDAKVLPPAAVTAKNEPAVPAPAATPAPAAQKEPEKAKAAPAKPAEQKPAAAPAVKETAKTKAEARPEAAARAADSKDTKKTAKEKKKEAKAAKAKAAGKFAVQAGYFESEKNAQSLVATLKEKGYEAYVLKNEVAGTGSETRTFHRVLIGTFDTGRKAAAYARELKQKDNLSVVIFRQ